MSKKIKLYQFASGSWPDRIGDTTLYYTEDYSRRANSVGGIFLDNPPRLPANCAGLVWRYYNDTDRFLLIHVQGSQVVNLSMGRNYPFRAGYEVSRDDMNAIGFNISAVLKAVPRIATMKGGRVALETEVDDKAAWPRDSKELADNIQQAILQGKQLFIALEVADCKYQADGVFKSTELQTLIDSIGQLSEDVRRYASFGFCVDGCYSQVLNDVPVVVYLKGRDINIPQGAVSTTWQEATSRTVIKSNGTKLGFKLPGADGPLLTAQELKCTIEVLRKKTTELMGDDWTVWFRLEHSLSEIETDTWETFSDYYGRMDEETQKKYVESVKEDSVNWKTNGLTEELFNLMEYEEEQIRLLQSRTVPLKHLLLKDGKYGFLYPKGKLPQGMEKVINAKFLQNLKLTEKDHAAEEIERWYDIFKEHDRISDVDVKKEFKALFEKYIIPRLTRQADLLHYMKDYPFVSSKCYQKPRDFQPLSDKEQNGLKQEFQTLFETWKVEAVKDIQINSIDEVFDILRKVVDKNTHVDQLKVEALKQMKAEQLSELLLENKDEVISYCEKLLDVIVKLSKDWTEWIDETVMPLVDGVLFGDNKKTGAIAEDLLDVKQWAGICENYWKEYPYVFFLIKKRLEILIGDQKTLNEICKDAKIYFLAPPVNETLAEEKKMIEHSKTTTTAVVPAEEEKADKMPEKETDKKKNSCQGTTEQETKKQEYHPEAGKAYPLIVKLINIVKNMENKNDSKNFEKFFSELKAAKKTKQNKQRLLSVGFVAGILLSVLCLVVYNHLPKCTIDEGETHIVKAQEGHEPRIVFAKIVSIDKQLMLQMASMSKQDTIESLIVGDSVFTDVCPDDMAALLRCNAAYYQIADTAAFTKMTAVFREDVKDMKAKDQKKDTVTISASAGHTLLEVAASHPMQLLAAIRYQSADSTGKTTEKSIDIPNATIRSSLFKNDTVNIYMDKPRYYFQVIKSIEAKLKEDNSDVRIAY